MCLWALNNPNRAILLISSDSDFGHALGGLKKSGMRVYLIHGSNAHVLCTVVPHHLSLADAVGRPRDPYAHLAITEEGTEF
jgi:hypothetical protein